MASRHFVGNPCPPGRQPRADNGAIRPGAIPEWLASACGLVWAVFRCPGQAGGWRGPDIASQAAQGCATRWDHGVRSQSRRQVGSSLVGSIGLVFAETEEQAVVRAPVAAQGPGQSAGRCPGPAGRALGIGARSRWAVAAGRQAKASVTGGVQYGDVDRFGIWSFMPAARQRSRSLAAGRWRSSPRSATGWSGIAGWLRSPHSHP